MSKQRHHEVGAEIDGPAELAWRMVTDPTQIKRWFTAEARVEERVGGEYRLEWTPEMVGEQKIAEWDPPKKLVLHNAKEDAWKDMVVTWTTEAKGDKTILRVVQSGIPADSEWDDFFDSTAQGWINALAILSYAARFADEPAKGCQVMGNFTADAQEAWDKVLGPELLNLGDAGKHLKLGDRFETTTAFGDEWKGEVLLNKVPGTDDKFVGSLGLGIDGGLAFMLGVEKHGPSSFMGGGMTCFGDHDDATLKGAQAVTDRLEELLGVD